MNREALRLAGVQMVKPKVESKRKIAKDYHRNIRRIDAPDEARKVAGCPKCPSWFETVEARNAHKTLAHEPRALLAVSVHVPLDCPDHADYRRAKHKEAIENMHALAAKHGAVVDEATLRVRVGTEAFDRDGKMVYGDDISAQCVPDFETERAA